MELDFFNSQCQSVSNKKRFGLCDEQDDKEPAYIDEQNGAKWIAIVENDELKERESKKSNNDWVKDGEKQLKRIIEYFEETKQSNKFTEKRAYIANKAHPIFKESQFQRMKNFKEETGYTLRIENRIKIPYMNF